VAFAEAQPFAGTLARRRVNPRALVGVGVAVAGVVVLTFLYRNQQPQQVLVLRAVHDVPAGAILSAADIQSVAEAVPDEVAATLVPASQQPALLERRVGQALTAGEFLTRGQLGSAVRGISGDQRIVTIPIDADAIAGMSLARGDQVEIAVTTGRNNPSGAETRTIVPAATIYDVSQQDVASGVLAGPPRSSVASGGRAAWISVTVDDAHFQALAQARWTGDLSVALLPAQEPR
jgi:hypothetical protein